MWQMSPLILIILCIRYWLSLRILRIFTYHCNYVQVCVPGCGGQRTILTVLRGKPSTSFNIGSLTGVKLTSHIRLLANKSDVSASGVLGLQAGKHLTCLHGF